MARQIRKFPLGTRVKIRRTGFEGRIFETGSCLDDYGRPYIGAKVVSDDGEIRGFTWNVLAEEA